MITIPWYGGVIAAMLFVLVIAWGVGLFVSNDDLRRTNDVLTRTVVKMRGYIQERDDSGWSVSLEEVLEPSVDFDTGEIIAEPTDTHIPEVESDVREIRSHNGKAAD